MKSIKLVLGLAVSVGLLVIVAAPALAAPEWYERANTKEEWKVIGTAIASVSEGELELEDSKTAVGAVRLKCKVKSTGTVGPKSADKIEAAELTECKVVKGTCGSPKAKAVHLPWTTELYTEGTEIRDRLKNSGAGLPGYTVTCVVIIKIEDTCEAEANAGVASNLETGIVEIKFDEKTPKAKCSQSKAETGTVAGTLKIRAASGVLISAK